MIDDLLDVTQSAEKLGKPAMHDYEEGKATLPFIYLYEAMDEGDRSRLAALHATILKPASQQWIAAKMQEYGIVARCFDEARTLIDEAVTLMQQAGERSLEEIAKAMIERSF